MLKFTRIKNYFWEWFVNWLTNEPPNHQTPLTNFERLRYELRPGDVLLVEGRSNISAIIRAISQSVWTHTFFYIGRLHDIDDPCMREHLQKFRNCELEDQLIIEAILGEGIVVKSLNDYEGEHLRICRPKGITRPDVQKVIRYAINQLGVDYNVRQLMDLARFMFPYWFLPKRWRSSLFEHNAGRPTKTVCSTMIAEAFSQVRFPIHPALYRDANGKLKMIRKNSQLVTPCDFDQSPYFDIIKYPMLDFDELGIYRKLPWDQTGVYCNNLGDCFVSDPDDLSELEPVTSAEELAVLKSDK